MIRLPRPLALLFGFTLFLAAAAAASAAPPDVEVHHSLAWGETVADVAARFGVPLNALVEANGLDDLHRVPPGRWLRLPLDGAEQTPHDSITYTVQPGDTLFAIATRFGTTVDALAALNGIADPSAIITGQVLTISIDRAPEPVTIDLGPLHDVEVSPSPVRRGQVLVIQAAVDFGVPVVGSVDGAGVPFVRDGDIVFGMLPVGLLEEPDARTLVLAVGAPGPGRAYVHMGLAVVAGQFPSDIISVPPDRTYLLDPAILQQEREILDQVFSASTVRRLWTGTYLEPITGTLTSAFGSRRVYNSGVLQSVHSGIDISGNIGTPVQASNGGRVVFAGPLQVHGNGVILDHGLGLYSAYYHLDSIAVALGQRVEKGEIVGAVGNTGLSTGAHLHWEMRLNNVPVDPMQWVYQTIP